MRARVCDVCVCVHVCARVGLLTLHTSVTSPLAPVAVDRPGDGGSPGDHGGAWAGSGCSPALGTALC